MEHSAKILLLGKTGVGKSSFINYFLGKNVAEAAAGKPVTREQFFAYEITDGRYPVEIFDTRGIEALNADSQLDELIAAIKRRNNSDNIFNWFHTIFYCISMSNPRFEDFEAKFIRRLQQELTQHIHIILTHCDVCSPDNIAHMRQRIASQLGRLDNIEIFEVVCVSKKKRNGKTAEPQGKEAVSERVFDLFLEDIAYKLSASYAQELRSNMVYVANRKLSRAEETVDKVVNFKTLVRAIQDEDDGESYMDSIFDNVWEGLQDDMARVTKEADEKFEKILKPAARLLQSYRGVVINSFAKDARLGFDDMIWDFQSSFSESDFDKKFSISAVFPTMARNGHVDRSGDLNTPQSFFGVMDMLGAGIHDLFNIKKNMKKALRSVFHEYVQSLPSEDVLQKAANQRIKHIIGG